MKKILFIGHEAELTGAPFVLLHLLRWVRKNRPDFHVEVLLLRDGQLRKEYEAVAEVHVVPADPRPAIVVRGIRYLQRRLGVKRRLKVPDLPPITETYDLIVGNTVASLEYLEYFKTRGIRTFCWLHEMRSVINSFYPEPGRFLELTKSVDVFVVASAAVEKAMREFGVTTRTEQVYEFSENGPVDEKKVADVRRSLGIPDTAFVVGGCGTVSFRKGTDLFVQIASKLIAEFPDIYFVWVGGGAGASDAEFTAISRQIDQLGLDRLVVTGVQKEPQHYFANMDLFILTSREDPFPLVCLEAASLAKPVMCFEDAGGIPEFVGDDAGAVIPFGDVAAFAERIREFYRDRNKLKPAGEAAYRKVHGAFSLDSSCRKMVDIIVDESR